MHPSHRATGQPPSIRDVSRLYPACDEQPEGVHQNVALAAFDTLVRVEAAMPPRSVVFTDWPSMMTTDGQAVRPACRRACWYIESWTQVQTPPFFQTRK